MNERSDPRPDQGDQEDRDLQPRRRPADLVYTAPAAGVVNTKTFTVTGTAADDHGVTGVTMTLRDVARPYLQDDGSARRPTTRSASRRTSRRPSTTWSKELTVPTEGTWSAQALAHDTGGNSSLDTVDRTWNVTENGQAPAVAISTPGSVVPPTAPQPVIVTPGDNQTFSGTATDDGTIKSVFVALLNNSTGENLTTDGTWGIDNGLNLYKLPAANITEPAAGESSYKWTWTTPQDLTPGNYTFAVVGLDNDDIATPQTAWALLTMNAVYAGDAPPDAALTTQGVQPASAGDLTLNLTGTATDDVGRLRGASGSSRTSTPASSFHGGGRWAYHYEVRPGPRWTTRKYGEHVAGRSKNRDLPKQGNWNVTAYAVDAPGPARPPVNTNATARYPVYPGDAAPTLTDDLLAPTENASFTDGRIYVSGTLRTETCANSA